MTRIIHLNGPPGIGKSTIDRGPSTQVLSRVEGAIDDTYRRLLKSLA